MQVDTKKNLKYKQEQNSESIKLKNIPDLICALNPLRSCQVLYHGEENHENAYTQLCLSM